MPFIFAGNKLFVSNINSETHAEMVISNPELLKRYGLKRTATGVKFIDDEDFRMVVIQDTILKFGDLVGRIGWWINSTIVSCWNYDQKDYANLNTCLSQMKQKHLINDAAKISTPIHGVVPISNIPNAQPITPEMAKKVDLYKQLHLMRGQEKHDAMKELGLRGSMKKSPLPPGQKWWAPTSEHYKGNP